MLNTPAQILKQYLIQPSGSQFVEAGNSGSWPVYVSVMPDGANVPDQLIALMDTTGIIKQRLLASGAVIETYGVQIRSRSQNYVSAYSILSQLSKSLAKVKRQIVSISGVNYTIDTIIRTSSVISLGQDEVRRSECSFNITIMLIESV